MKSKKRKRLNLKPFMRCDRASLDIDYFNKLNPKEQAWLQRWAENEYNAYFRDDGKDIITDPKERTKASTKKKYRQRNSELINTDRFDLESEDSEKEFNFGHSVLVLKENKS